MERLLILINEIVNIHKMLNDMAVQQDLFSHVRGAPQSVAMLNPVQQMMQGILSQQQPQMSQNNILSQMS